MSASDRSLDSSDAASNSASASSSSASAAGDPAKAKAIRDTLNITEDYRDEFVHGDKGAQYQKYIVLHDTERSNANTMLDIEKSRGSKYLN